jgi:hypothetical protein
MGGAITVLPSTGRDANQQCLVSQTGHVRSSTHMDGYRVNQELDRKWGTDTLGVDLVAGKAKPIRSGLVEFVAGRNIVQ